ncbi:zinc ribbon domain-containing protein [Tardiphaga sp.]|uniref:double zinc ribbon domain-containing protein n=1 Tax=Tardiphaga sp. TaxID=1926292 RepID=UPI00352A599C
MSSHFLGRLLGGHGGSGHGGGGHGSPWDAARLAQGPFSQPGPQAPGHGSIPATAQRVLVCPNCRGDNSPDSRFCGQCGQRLGPPEQACAKCGVTLASGVKFCPSCGEAAAGAKA